MFDPCPPSFNLARYVLDAGQACPDKIALAVLGKTRAERWSYGRLTQTVWSAATGLTAAGLGPGDRLLLRIGNEPSFPILFLAACAIGVVPVPTSAQLTVAEVTALAQNLAPKAIAAVKGVSLPQSAAPVLDAADLMSGPPVDRLDYDMGAPDRPGYIVYTSGTGGSSRGVVHAHRAVWARRMMWDGWYGLRNDDRVLHAGAFNWTYTLGTGLLDPWARGATALIPAADVAPAMLPMLLTRHNATIFAAAPGVYRQLLKHDTLLMPTLRHGLSAGEKLPDITRARWETATETPIFEAYGMSECSTFVSGSPNHPAPAGTLGFPQPGRRVSIRQDGQDAAIGAAGTIAIHRSDPGLMLGYLGRAEETASRFDGDWFLTGDTGALAADGSLTYLGRSDDMLNAGGYRVSPIEIEDALSSHPAVAEAAACDLRVKSDTTIIGAFWTGDASAEASLQDHLASQLAPYKRPRILIRTETLPRGANNKLLRQKLRRDWEAENGHA